VTHDFWNELRRRTPARIGLGRRGNGLPTSVVLETGAAHALARDAVHQPLDVERLVEDLLSLDIGEPLRVSSAAVDRATYLTRPDLGRRLGSEVQPDGPFDLIVVFADGLSSEAVQRHAVPLLAELLPKLDGNTKVGPPVVATLARVALGDQVAAALKAQMVLVLIGERPGLSTSDSLGAYLTWEPGTGVLDAARNCVSNIRPPHGLDYTVAARTLASLIGGARRIGATGVRLKDTGNELGS
jgi:ethanolamine ammonia-lyase small subunit